MPMLEQAGINTMTQPICAFECEDLCFTADGKQILGPLNFALPDRGLSVIMGPNGAGKSCLLRLMHGLIFPTQGKAIWGGVSASDRTRRTQAMVFQKPVLLRRSVRANLDYVLSGPRKERNSRIEAQLAQVGLLDFAKTPARRLSGGEQQRLALARALAIKPSVLLLDEATASLDPASVQIIEDILRAQCEAGTKIILVTHDIAQARRIADDVTFLHRGHVLEQAASDTFFHAPASPQANAYLAGEIITQ